MVALQISFAILIPLFCIIPMKEQPIPTLTYQKIHNTQYYIELYHDPEFGNSAVWTCPSLKNCTGGSHSSGHDLESVVENCKGSADIGLKIALTDKMA